MPYVVYLDKIPLPVTPESINTKIINRNKTITLINDDEINILKSPGLTEIDFEVLIPQVRYPFAIYEGEFKRASYYLELFEKLKINTSPFQFIVSRTDPKGNLLFDTNLTVSLEDYKIEEKAENGFDLVVSLNLKQFKYYATKTFTIKKETNNPTKKKPVVKPNNNRPAKKPKVKTYIVRKGDTLWGICQKELGSGSKYKEIAKINKISNPNKIYPGQVIKLG